MAATPAEQLLALHHRPGGFVLPNAWDAGSARILEHAGFPAIATTSAGIAFSLGRPDGTLTRDEALAHAARIASAVTCPVTFDLEAGYGDTPAAVERTVHDAVRVGAAGANIEDAAPGSVLFSADEAVERLRAVRRAAPPGTFVLNARTDAYLAGVEDPLGVAVDRGRRYAEAGADCVFVPGVEAPDDIRALAEAIPVPLNVVAGLTGPAPDADSLRALGVRRISVGGSLARAALGYVERAAQEMRERGTFGFTTEGIPMAELQRRFA